VLKSFIVQVQGLNLLKVSFYATDAEAKYAVVFVLGKFFKLDQKLFIFLVSCSIRISDNITSCLELIQFITAHKKVKYKKNITAIYKNN